MIVEVKIRDPRFKGQFIELSMKEYRDFIKEQADLLGITTPVSPLKPIISTINFDAEKVQNVSEVAEKINDELRRNTRC